MAWELKPRMTWGPAIIFTASVPTILVFVAIFKQIMLKNHSLIKNSIRLFSNFNVNHSCAFIYIHFFMVNFLQALKAILHGLRGG